MNYELIDVDHMWQSQWQSIPGAGFFWARQQTTGTFSNGWSTGSLQMGGYDCDDTTNYINSIKRGIIKVTTTIANPVHAVFEIGSTSNHGLGGSITNHKCALVGTTFTSDADVWSTTSYNLTNYLTGSILSSWLDFDRTTPGYGSFDLRFTLNSAGLDYIASTGTHYFGWLHMHDIDSASFEWANNQNSYVNIGYSYPATEPAMHPRLNLWGNDVEEVYTLVPTSNTASYEEQDGRVENTAVYSWHTAGSNFGVLQDITIEGGNPTTITFFRFDLSDYAGKTCVYAKFGALAAPDTTPPSVLRWQVGIVRKQLDFDTLDYNYYSASLPWTDFLTGDGEDLQFLDDYDDGIGALYYKAIRYAEATGSHAWLTHINNVLDGTDKFPENKLTFVCCTSESVAQELKIYNGVHSNDDYAGPYLMLGFSASAGEGGGVEYVTVGLGTVTGLETITW